MPDKPSNLYFIAVVLKNDLGEAILDFKKDMSERFASKAALRSPSHITVHMPFRKHPKHEEFLTENIEEVAAHHQPFEVMLHDFGCFPPRVIFVNVRPSEELDHLQADIQEMARRKFNLFNANYRNHPFTPHVTIAFRDLSKQKFQAAWESYEHKKFDALFKCDSISLLKHNGRLWEEHHIAPLRIRA